MYQYILTRTFYVNQDSLDIVEVVGRIINSLNQNHSFASYLSLNNTNRTPEPFQAMACTTRLLPSLTRPLVHSFRPSIRSLSCQLPRQSASSLLPLHHRSFTTTPYRFEAPPSSGTPIGRIDRKLKIFFTCTASVPVDPQNAQPGADARPCGHRSSHEFSKRSYEKGVVIVQCPECENRHLIG